MFTSFVLSLSLALPPGNAPALDGADVTWVDGSFDAALERARSEHKPLLLYLWSATSDYSSRVYNETLSTPEGAQRLSRFLCYTGNVADPEPRALVETYGVRTMPTLIAFDTEGVPVDSIQGYEPAPAYLFHLDQILAGRDGIPDLRDHIAALEDPNSAAGLMLRYRLAWKLYEVNERAEHDELLAAIRTADPKGETLAGSRANLIQAAARVAEDAGSTDFSIFRTDDYLAFNGDPTQWDLAPLEAIAKKVKLREARFEAWDTLATLENSRGNPKGAVRAWTQAVKYVPEAKETLWCWFTAQFLLGYGDASGTKGKKLALQLAQRAAKGAEREDVTSFRITSRFGHVERDVFVAQVTSVLAGAYRLNGNKSKARATLERCSELDPSGGYDALLSQLD